MVKTLQPEAFYFKIDMIWYREKKDAALRKSLMYSVNKSSVDFVAYHPELFDE